MRSKKSERLPKSSRVSKSAHPRKPAGAKESSGLDGVFATVAVLLVICVVGAAMVIAREPSDGPTATVSQPETATAAAPKTIEGPKSSAPARTMTPDANVTPAKSSDEKPVEQASSTKAPVTITGCLARDGSDFRLTNTRGVAAPKARSWKSGFLRKSTASIAVVDLSKTQYLPTYVGQRVGVTGVLVDRQMRVQSIWRVAGSCN
jgi:hypothetical protein